MHSNLADSDRVVIRCPACGASEEAHPGVLNEAPRIVCRKCGETWPAPPGRRKRRGPRTPERGDRETIEAERRPLVTYSSGADQAWAAKVEGDYWPEQPQRSRVPAIAAAMAATVFIAAFFGGRYQAVAALPDLAGLYAAVGLRVNLDGLVIEEVAAKRNPGDGGSRLTVHGVIRNVSSTEQPVPALTASVHDSAMRIAGWRGFDPPARKMAVGEAAPFRLELEGVPRQAGHIVIRFRRPAEPRRAAMEGPTAAR